VQPTRDSLSLETAKKIDQLCDRFEAQWLAGKRPRIEDYLAAAPSALQPVLLQSLLPIELELIRKSGKTAVEADYQKRFPASAKLVAKVFQEAASRKTEGSESSISNSNVATAAFQSRSAAASVRKDAPPPAQIGRFKILSVLGQGGFGSVYRARDPQLEREVAIKVPRPGVFATTQDRERFLGEARAAAAVQHPNLCPVYEVNSDGESLYIVMAMIPGVSLAEYLRERKNPLSARQSALIVRKLALALEAAHAKGVVHRDLKPANILFDRERKDVVVTDFGLARRSQADVELTQAGAVMGTPAYMSPEQARGDTKTVGPAADIFSLGVILYELLTGVRPFTGSMGEILGKVQHVAPEPPSKVKPGIDSRLEKICLKAMAKAPKDRFGSMREFAFYLGEFLKDAPTGAIAPGAPKARPDAPPPSEAAQMAEIFAAMSIERKAETKKIEQSQRGLAKLILGVGGCLGVMLVLAICLGGSVGGWLYWRGGDAPSGPTVTVTLQNITHLHDNSVHYYLDGKQIDSKKLEGPLKLAVGPHKLEGKRGNETVELREFNVGQEDDQKEIVVVTAEPDGPPGLRHEFKHAGSISGLAVSPDGEWIVGVYSQFSMFNGKSGSRVGLWQLKDGEKIHEENLDDAETVSFGNSKLPFIGFRGGFCYVVQYDLSNPKRWKDKRRFECSRGGYVTTPSISRDGKTLLIGTLHDGPMAIHFWNTSDAKRIASVDNMWISSIAPDGKRYFAGKGDDLILHEIRDDGKVEAIKTFKGHTSTITRIACSPDGRLVAAGAGGPTHSVRLWDVESAKVLDIARHSGGVTSVSFSPDGKRLLTSGGEGTLRLSDVKTGDVIYEVKEQGVINCAVFSPGGRMAVFGQSDGKIKVWQLPK
jgi:WD40 repeat protein